jgi:aminomethyltransferase
MFKSVYRNDEMKRRQHLAVREATGWYLFTHQLLEVNGPDATAFLEKNFPNPIGNLSVGGARYTTMLNEDGIIIDDLIVFRMGEAEYWVSTLYIHRLEERIAAYKGDLRFEIKNITNEWDMYAVQGPKSKDVVNAILAEPVDDMRFFTIRDNKVGDAPVKVARSGFTGEKLGYEIYVAPGEQFGEKDPVFKALTAKGPELGATRVTETQILAWTLSTEKGFYLMCDLRGTNPLEAELDKGIDWDKDFIGRDALLKVKEAGAAREFVGFTVANDEAFIHGQNLGGAGTPVVVDDEKIGCVTKYTFGYVIDTNIGYALVDKGRVKPGDHVLIRGEDAVITDKVFA